MRYFFVRFETQNVKLNVDEYEPAYAMNTSIQTETMRTTERNRVEIMKALRNPGCPLRAYL